MRLTIVGLDVVGTSIGLALKAATRDIPITGHDPEGDHIVRAQKLGAIDRSHWNLVHACEGADLIVLDLPLAEIEKTLTAIGPDLRPGATILDTTPIKTPIMALARRVLPPGVGLIGGHLVAALAEPSAEALQGAPFYLVIPEDAPSECATLASDFVTALGARPHYIDADEHDAYAAATSQLPILAGLAAVSIVQSGPGARERGGFAGPELLSLAALLEGVSAEGLLANRTHLLDWLDTYLAELEHLRSRLQTGERESLDADLEKARVAAYAWLRGETREDQPDAFSEASGMLRRMLFGGLGRRPRSREH